ncbi:peptidase inhibitor family I36 protein [Actinomadura sp. 3N508]|uniref:peptidase inhibitor family I36 protein n=1 Tax=Actinomadura sp. 3N508 TaxID=3375153 RepID=UPI00378BB14E
MIKSLKALAIGLPIVAATLVAVPGTASADLGQCGRGYFCAWDNDGFKGAFAQWFGNSRNWGDKNMNDRADSVFNNARSSSTVPDNVAVYIHAGYSNMDICVLPGETYDAGMNDNDYSSHQWLHGC